MMRNLHTPPGSKDQCLRQVAKTSHAPKIRTIKAMLKTRQRQFRQKPSGGQKLAINGTTPDNTSSIIYLDIPLL